MRSLVLLLVLPLLALPAQAHVEAFSQAKPMDLGPYTGLVEPRPSPIYANSALSMTAIFSRTADGTFATDVRARLELVAPDGLVRNVSLEPDGTGYLVGAIAVEDAGDYVARIVLMDAAGEYANETTFTAYPDLPLRLRSEDPNAPDPLVGRPYELSIETLDAVTLRRRDIVTDLAIHLEHWTDDHGALLSTTTHAMAKAETGVWRLDHTFPRLGMYHLRFSSVSGGFNIDDVPILHVYANEPPPAQKGTPLPAAGALVAVLLGAALVARRR